MVPTSQKGVVMKNESVKATKSMKGNKKNFNKKDVNRAEALQWFQHVGGHPSDATIHHSTMTNGIKISPFVPKDVKLMLDVLGENVYGMKGTMI